MPALVIQTSFLGDTILSTPLLTELAARGPVDILVTPMGATILHGNPSVRRLLVYDKRGADAGLGGLRRVARRLRSEHYDAAYLAQGSLRSAVLARAARIPRLVGFDTSAGRAFYTERVRYRRDRHHAERLWRLAAGDDAPSPGPEAIRPHLYPGADERAAVDAALGGFAAAGAPLIALAPGSIWGTKRWPHFTGLVSEMPETRFVVVGSGDDRELAAAIVAVARGRVLDLTGRLSLLGSAELLRRCAALVANDSAPTHLASGVGTPTLTLFGPTVPAYGFGPLAPRSESLGVELPCRPCHAHGPMECPLGHFLCMRSLEPSRVAARLRNLCSSPTDS